MLSEEQVRAYREQGVLEVRGVLPSGEVSALASAWVELKAQIETGGGPVQRAARFISGPLPPRLRDVYRSAPLVEIANQLMGPDLALYLIRLLVKDDAWNGVVDMHQDMPYFHGGLEKLSVMVPLTPFNRETGAVGYVLGSHKLGNVGVRGTIDHSKYPDLPFVVPDLVPGDILMSNFLTWHASGAATAPSPRPVIQIVYQPSSDGSYFTLQDAPILVSGEWRTEHFLRYSSNVAADAPAPTVPAMDKPAAATETIHGDPTASGRGWLGKLLGRG